MVCIGCTSVMQCERTVVLRFAEMRNFSAAECGKATRGNLRNVPHLIFRKLPLDNFPHSAKYPCPTVISSVQPYVQPANVQSTQGQPCIQTLRIVNQLGCNLNSRRTQVYVKTVPMIRTMHFLWRPVNYTLAAPSTAMPFSFLLWIYHRSQRCCCCSSHIEASGRKAVVSAIPKQCEPDFFRKKENAMRVFLSKHGVQKIY